LSAIRRERNAYARRWYAANKDRISAREKELRLLRPSRQPEARAAAHLRKLARLGKTLCLRPMDKEEKRRRQTEYKRGWSRKKKGIPVDAPLRDDAGRSPEYYRARHTATERARLAAKKKRTPPWLTQAHYAEIEGQYHFAKVMERITGQKHHVDHIEPLQGASVSGLHVPWNLRAIPARDNFAKGNRRIEA